jgi:hypothetical protein
MSNKGNWRNELKEIYHKESAINVDKEWAILEQKISKNRKRRVGAFLFFIGMLVSLVSISTQGVKNKSEKEITEAQVKSNTSEYKVDDLKNSRALSNQAHGSNASILYSENNKSEQQKMERHNIVPVKSTDSEEENFEKFESKPAMLHDANEIGIENIDKKNSVYKKGGLLSARLNEESSKQDEIALKHKNEVVYALPSEALNLIEWQSKSAFQIINLPISNRKKKVIDFIDIESNYGLLNYKSSALFAEKQKKDLLPKGLDIFSINISAGKNLKSDFYLFGGLGYEKKTEKLHITTIETINSTLDNQIVESYNNAQGIKVQTYGKKTVSTTIEKQSTRYNRQNEMQLHLGLGRNWHIGNLKLVSELKYNLSILHTYNGHIYDGNSLIPMEKLYSIHPVNLSGSTGFIYPLSNALSLNFGYNLSFEKLKYPTILNRTEIGQSFYIGLRKNIN